MGRAVASPRVRVLRRARTKTRLVAGFGSGLIRAGSRDLGMRGGDHGVHKPRSPVTAPHRMLTAHTGYEIEPTGLIVTTPAQRSSEGPPDVAAG